MRESRVTGNCHARFGERGRETRLLRDGKVRSAPTPFSPLLANVALHGMEEAVHQAFKTKEGKPSLIHYVDDFVVLHPTREGVEKARQMIEQWLQGIGLELKPSKTRIAHTLHPMQGKAGFDFLGMNIQHYPARRTRSAKKPDGTLGLKTFIKPSEEAIKRYLRELGRIVRKRQSAPQAALIDHLNPVIKGWANYYRTVVAKESYARCDHRLYSKLRSWARRRHPNKTIRWVSRKYWALDQGEGWTFKAPDGSVLKKHAAIPIKRHVKVKGATSPYGGDLLSWAQRLKAHPLVDSKVGYLLISLTSEPNSKLICLLRLFRPM